MKISYRILISAIVAVAVVFASSILSFYSVTGKVVLALAGLALFVVFLLFILDRKNSRAKAEYAAFISLVNRNLSLRDMSDAVLERIIKAAGYSVGRLYMTVQNEPVLLSSYGVVNETAFTKIDLYERVIEKGEEAEFQFTENFPVIRSGLVELQVRSLLIYPVIYNGSVIAVLEMASIKNSNKWAKEYLASIKDHLSSALSKSFEMHQLETLLNELKISKAEPAEIKPAEAKPVRIEPAVQVNIDAVIPVNAVSEKAEKTILVIDPVAENRKIISGYLSSKSYKIIQSESAEEGVRGLLQNKPFAVTLSVSSNGASTWEALKSLKENPGLPVILYNTVEPLNFGYGLGVYDYTFHSLNGALIASYAGRIPEVKSAICAGFEDGSKIKDAGDVKLTFVKEQNEAFKLIKKLQPQIVFINAFMPQGQSVALLDRLKASFDTKDIPVVFCIKPGAEKEALDVLTAAVEKVTIASKGHRNDILKAIRDRIRLEEGTPEEDTSAILIETEPEETEQKPDTAKLASNRVLIVDDDDGTLTEVGDIVSRSGCETIFAQSGEECLSALQKTRPDLILLDIRMPHMDGFETIRRIKAEKNLKDIPVFALTAHEMIDEKEILIKNGFDDFISKPVDSGSLSFKIEKVLNNIAEC